MERRGIRMGELMKIRNILLEIVDIIDELLECEKKEAAGEDVRAECEDLFVRYVIKFAVLQSL
jgi:hypothetical protein